MLDLSFRPGQVVLVLRRLEAWERRTGREPTAEPSTIAKVGRKWATLEGHRGQRFSLQTLELDTGDFGQAGRVYVSAEHMAAEVEKARLWEALAGRFRFGGRHPPAQLWLADLSTFMAALDAAESLEPDDD